MYRVIHCSLKTGILFSLLLAILSSKCSPRHLLFTEPYPDNKMLESNTLFISSQRKYPFSFCTTAILNPCPPQDLSAALLLTAQSAGVSQNGQRRSRAGGMLSQSGSANYSYRLVRANEARWDAMAHADCFAALTFLSPPWFYQCWNRVDSFPPCNAVAVAVACAML